MTKASEDKGAHFHKCDFQVHTPRDAGWKGGDATTQVERKTYAQELIRACREKGLDAIAITDHHDLTFFPYVRAAAKAEVSSDGKPVHDEHQIIVFPGIELTLSSPACQAILLLDAGFDEARFDDVLNALTLDAVDPAESKVKTVDPISPAAIKDLNHLEETLSQRSWLKGRFIILPNVTDQGHKDLLRDGFQKHYKEMHCVGGYVDGDYGKLRNGRKNILEGRQQNNGYQPIAVLQTSDNRKRNHSDLGKYITWIKWSEPSAEALRQACLAKESRLSHIEPELPPLWITSMSVSDSKFLGSLELDFNQQYSAIIGGRGTGKSTLLEYLRWCLCDQPVESEATDIVQGKRKSLIENTLQKFAGEVHVSFLINDVTHIVKRNSKTHEIFLKIGNGSFESASEDEVRTLLPIQAYSQKQLSSVGVRVNELMRFVELPVKQPLDGVRSQIHDTASRMRIAYGNYVRKKEVEAEANAEEVEKESLSTQLAGLRSALKGLSESDQEVIDRKEKYDNEETIIDELKGRFESAQEQVIHLKEAYESDIEDDTVQVEIHNEGLVNSIRKEYESRFSKIAEHITAVAGLFEDEALRTLNVELEKWSGLKEKFDKKYEAAKAKTKINQQQLNQIRKIEGRIKDLRRSLTAKRKSLKALGNPHKTYKDWRKKWIAAHREKMELLSKQCDKFTTLSVGYIKAEIKNCIDTDGLISRLKTALSGMNIREDKLAKLCDHLAKSDDAFTAWNEVVDELEALSLFDTDSPYELPETPILSKSDFIQSERKRIAASFNSERWIDLSTAELVFNPKFYYCANIKKDEFIAFADASAGQQATALLTVLLNQDGAPLIIDQPEDDVDSKMIEDVIERVWIAKTKRQLIFSSHNANFVVNGDAELVICCDYRKAGDQTKGAITALGAIDNSKIRKEITTVTEGGEHAFKLRKSKYGF